MPPGFLGDASSLLKAVSTNCTMFVDWNAILFVYSWSTLMQALSLLQTLQLNCDILLVNLKIDALT